MSLHIVRVGSGKEPITVPEFLSLFSMHHFDHIEARAREIRKNFIATDPITDHKTFCAACIRFYLHDLRSRFPSIKSVEIEDFSFGMVWPYHFKRWYTGGLFWWEVARNCVTGHQGGFIRFLDNVTDGIVKQDIEQYIDDQLRAYMPVPEDERMYERFIDELLATYGYKAFFPDPYISPVVARALLRSTTDLHGTLKAFFLHTQSLQRHFRT